MGEAKIIRRAGAIGDVHCEDEVLAQALRVFAVEGVDVSLCVGDIVDGEGDVDRCCALLAEHQVATVAGNHERWLLESAMRNLPHATVDVSDTTRAFLERLPRVREFETPLGGLLLCHGVGEDDMAELRPDTRGYALQAIPTLRELMLRRDVSFMVGGHTHERMARQFQGVTVVNVGTLHRAFESTVQIIDFDAQRIEVFAVNGDGAHPAESLPLPLPVPLPDDAPQV